MKRLILCVIVAGVLLIAACSGPQQQQQWGQGYESQQGYMQPDHSYFYYWMIYHTTFGYAQPSIRYHVYVPPAGYSRSYRPWQAAPRSYSPNRSYSTPSYNPPTRSTGGFSGYSTPRSVTPPTRSTGGFSTPRSAPSAPSRSSGGFSSSRPSSSRSSGGFSRSSGRR